MSEVWTPLKIMQWAVPFLAQKGISHPRLDVEILIAHALKLDRLKVYLQFDRPLNADELSIIRELLKRRSQHEPIQYILGKREFFGLAFRVTPGVLIPRPETEQLVEKAIQHLEQMDPDKRAVLDLGTGCGCIAISIAKNVSCQVWATDISQKALELTQLNAQELGVQESIHLRQGNWFKALKSSDPPQFGVIVSNPPYIPFPEKPSLSPEVRDFEPEEALFGGEDGLQSYREVAKGLPNRLFPSGAALFEIHANSYDKVASILAPLNWQASMHQDLQGFPRVILIKNQ